MFCVFFIYQYILEIIPYLQILSTLILKALSWYQGWDDTTLMAESEEELKSLLKKVKTLV